MRAALLRGCRTGAYFLGAFFCLWLGYRLKTYLVIHEERVLVVWRESPYLSFSLPVWIANIVVGVLLFGTLLLIVPNFIGIRKSKRLRLILLSVLVGVPFCIWSGYWLQKHAVILDERLLLVLRESPYRSFSMPFWSVCIVAGGVLCGLLVLVGLAFHVVRETRAYSFIVFSMLLLLCSLPLYFHIDTGRFNYENLLRFLYHLVFSGAGVALCFRGLAGLRHTEKFHVVLSRFFLSVCNISPRTFLGGVFVGCMLGCCFISWFVFNAAPGFLDSCAYMFQARLFAHGVLYAPLPPEPDFFEMMHVIISGKWYTQYPPGYPAILALGVLFGIPWLVNPVLGALTIVGTYLLAKELYGDRIARLTALLTCGSSFFLFMSSEFMAHASTLLFVTVAFLSFVRWVKQKSPLFSAVVCGGALGMALLCRPYTTVCIGMSMAIGMIVMRKKISLRHVCIGGIPILAASCVYLLYNAVTTGNPLLFGYIALHGKSHYPGFHSDPWIGEPHTVAQGIKYLLGNLNALNYYLFEWPMPCLFFACFFLVYGEKTFWEWLLMGWIAAPLVGHIFYFFNQLAFGPRFMYETLPALTLLTSRGLVLSTRLLASWRSPLAYAHARNMLCLITLGLFLFAVIFSMPGTAKAYQSYGKDVTIHKYLETSAVARALVFIKGSRPHWVHYPFNTPFASPHIYAKDKGPQNLRLAEKFPGYRYFIADEEEITEVSIDEL